MKYEIIYNGVAYQVTVERTSNLQSSQLSEDERPPVIPIIIVGPSAEPTNIPPKEKPIKS